ncbi:hypothetical protein BO94DRAFT_326402 [Aspergillus sclerotioniger CBS 115572]|uniref:Uncharacterized protein n=1 Tax=Aspergillus sclerotioniger CBS 115572 TaxID=1450535 RepID=A0A317X6L9_9EURO|nr:hypothetical protein BO94DRAFT_326402 [Aspergillus sclerotioniger CBS 115572]PWY94274.1 hypothetical protein BO94DRAFT_326402 [Aspergillus sclerotioniger CBS 115572]
MSKDSTPTQIHMHHPRLADYFEDFTRPHHTSTSTNTSGNTTTTIPTSGTNTTITYGSSSSPPSYRVTFPSRKSTSFRNISPRIRKMRMMLFLISMLRLGLPGR